VVQNISASGALLSGADPYEVGTPLTVALDLGDERAFPLDAHVVRRAPADDAFAIAFVAESADIASRIESFARAEAERRRRVDRVRVLVVNESAEGRAALARDVAALGRIPLAFAWSEEAKEYAHDPEYPYDSVIVDAESTGGSGRALLRYLGEHHPSVRRVMVAPDPSAPRTSWHAVVLGCDAVLRSPWRRVDLARALC